MAGILDPKTGLLTQAPEGTTINNTGVVDRPISSATASPIPAVTQPDLRSVISSTPQTGFIQAYDTQNNYNPVYVPKGKYVPGISLTPKQITTSSLQGAGTTKLPGVDNGSPAEANAITAGAQQTVADIVSQLTPPETATSKQQQDLLNQMASLVGDQANKAADQLTAEQSAGIPQLKAQFSEINSQILRKVAEANALDQSYQAANTQAEGSNFNLSRLQGEQAQNYRMYLAQKNAKASEIGLLQAQSLGLQGQIQSAQETANRAVDLKYSSIESKLNTYQAQLNALMPTLNKEEKTQALAQQVLLDRQKQEIAEKKENEKAIQSALMDYFKAGGTDTRVANAISSAKSVAEAQSLAGMQVGRIVQEDRTLDNAYKRAQIANIQSEINNRGQQNKGYDPTEILAFAQQYASTGKIPTGIPKGSFGVLSQVAKELPKPDGTLVNKNTGIAPDISATEQEAIAALQDINKRLPGLRADFDKMIPGLISGTIGNLFPSKTKQNYLSQRDEILNLLLKARSGAAVSEQEFQRYSKLLPSTFNKTLFLGGSGVNKIDNFTKSIQNSLDSKLQSSGLSIYGYSKVKVGDQMYTVGDIVNNGTQSARVNPDGTLTLIQ